ncbi:response regulator [Clostridia bacterium OttesenSCG-928-F22]|nr:response regulator [Clostridia bacterium OttesenSCG-928-F22]
MVTQQEGAFRALLEGTSQIILFLNMEGEYVLCSSAYLKAAGIREFSTLAGKKAFAPETTVFGGYTGQQALDELRSIVQGNQRVKRQLSISLREGAPSIPYEVCVLPVYASGGAPEGALLLLDDQSALQQESSARLKEEEAGRAKMEFLTTLSHEIRVPMNAILGMSEILQGTPLTEEQQSYLKNISIASGALLTVVNNVLHYSAIRTNVVSIQNEPFDLLEMLHTIQSTFSQRCANKRLVFAAQFGKELPKQVKGDKMRIAQMLEILLDNALKYTSRGTVELLVTAEESGIRFVVKDSGIGMKEEQLGLLFHPFEQMEQRKQAGITGTGLGLAIAGSLTELMGGEIHAASEEGVGSTFTLTLPLKEHRQQTTKTDESILFYAPKATALVVDDMEMNIYITKSMLELFQVQVDTALSGAQALEKAESTQYDVIFMDYMMPEMDGMETTKRIRAGSALNADTAIIALTANTVDGMKEVLLNNGFDEFLSKPLHFKTLQECLLQWIPREKITEVDPPTTHR